MYEPFENLENFEATFGEELKDAPKGEVVIRLIKGGNEYMIVGDTKCGLHAGHQSRLPCVGSISERQLHDLRSAIHRLRRRNFHLRAEHLSFPFCKKMMP